MSERPPRPYTETSLERAAVRYLSRYPASEARLRMILTRKLANAQRNFNRPIEGDPAELVAKVIETCREVGLLDDSLYAKALVQSEHRRGRPARVIAAKLREKGVPEAIAAPALEFLATSTEDPDLEAAHAYARRRRFGTYRQREVADADRADRKRKDLASMARAGFSYGAARRALEGDTGED